MHLISFLAVFVAIFLYGMSIMRYGLFHLTQQWLQNGLLQVTKTPLRGMIAGILFTTILQSSSAVTVMVIALCSAGYLTFEKALGVILGTNIGTTVTLEIISIDLGKAIIPMLLIGILFMSTSRKKWFEIGSILLGFSLLFIAMGGFSSLSNELQASHLFKAWQETDPDHHWNGIIVGTILTALLQSSTAVTGIVMGIMEGHTFELSTGIAIMLGANIGTCMTAYLASLRATKDAKLTAYAHIWLNLLGVAFFYPLIPYLTKLSLLLSDTPDLQLAHASIIFNVIVSLLFLPFIRPFALYIHKLHGRNTI